MKYLLVLVMLVNLPVLANWEKVTENDSGSEFLVDFQTLRKDGNRVKFWRVLNYSKAVKLNGQDVLSFRSRTEVDCKEETYRFLTITAYSQRNARGEDFGTHTYSEFDSKWEHVPPTSAMWTVLNAVCKAPAR